MKVIELGREKPTLDDVIGLASDDIVVLRKPDGSVYAISQVDDFEVEANLLNNNPKFMKLLRRLSQEEASISLQELRKELAL